MGVSQEAAGYGADAATSCGESRATAHATVGARALPRGLAPGAWARWVERRAAHSATPSADLRVAHRIVDGVQVDEASGCWLWRGAVNSRGYGQLAMRRPGRQKSVATSVHRLVLQLSGEMLGAADLACHHCDTKRCCNPAHLYVGTAATNSRDAKARGQLAARRNPVARANAGKSACPHGHLYDDMNTKLVRIGDRLERRCRACQRTYDRARAARRRREVA